MFIGRVVTTNTVNKTNAYYPFFSYRLLFLSTSSYISTNKNKRFFLLYFFLTFVGYLRRGGIRRSRRKGKKATNGRKKIVWKQFSPNSVELKCEDVSEYMCVCVCVCMCVCVLACVVMIVCRYSENVPLWHGFGLENIRMGLVCGWLRICKQWISNISSFKPEESQ